MSCAINTTHNHLSGKEKDRGEEGKEEYYAPINANPHYPPPGQYQGTVGRFEAPGVGDLTDLDHEILGDY